MPKSTEDYYKELLAQGQQYQQQANDLLAQYDNRPAFAYDAATDPMYQTVKNQYVLQGQRAMKDTMGQAAGLTGGYGSTYSQSVGNQAYNDYLTKLSAQIPQLAQQARAAYDAEGQRMLDRYNIALNAANTAYGQGRDALGDLRYEQEWNYNRERDALADQRYRDELAYQQGRDAESDRRWQMQWDQDLSNTEHSRQQAAQGDAYDRAMVLIRLGRMPSDEQLRAAGLSAADAQYMASYYAAMAAGTGGSSGGSGGSRGSGGGGSGSDKDGKGKDELPELKGDKKITDSQKTSLWSYARQYGINAAKSYMATYYKGAPNYNAVMMWLDRMEEGYNRDRMSGHERETKIGMNR